MKKTLLILFYIPMLFSCEEYKKDTNEIDLCRCLNEPGNTDWAKENKSDCDEAISNRIGVDNWESVNFSKNVILSKKWDKMVDECVNNQLESEAQDNSSQEISFEEAEAFMKERFEISGQKILDGKITYHNGGKLKVYYFISQSTQHIGYYCLAGVSSKKLEILSNIDCGRDEILSIFRNK